MLIGLKGGELAIKTDAACAPQIKSTGIAVKAISHTSNKMKILVDSETPQARPGDHRRPGGDSPPEEVDVQHEGRDSVKRTEKGMVKDARLIKSRLEMKSHPNPWTPGAKERYTVTSQV